MNKVTLYPELIEYIFDYCSAFMTEDEQNAKRCHIAMVKSNGGKIERAYTFSTNRKSISVQEHVLNLLTNGYESFKEKVAERIYNEHKDELELNLCPKCFKIARTPLAKQCRYCFYTWHRK